MNVLNLLGIANVGRVLSLLAVVASATAAAGVWAGVQWERGVQAQSENRQLRDDATSLRTAADTLRLRATDIVQDMQTSARRMDAIAARNWEQFDALDTLYLGQRDAFERQLAMASAAELLACHIGTFGMRVWSDAAYGFTADPTTSADTTTGTTVGAVPVDTSDAGQRQREGSAEDMATSGADLPPVSIERQQPDRGRP